jgi:hypothetical protein
MRGNEHLIAMRNKGYKPRSVWVECLPMNSFARGLIRPCIGNDMDLHLEPRDIETANRLDLRCMMGLNVYVNGPNDETTQAVADACVKAGAVKVIASFFDLSRRERDWLVKMITTTPEGVRTTWPQ